MSQCWYGNKEEEQLISDHELCILPHCAFLPTLNMPLCAGWNRLNSDYIYIEFNHVSLLASAFLSLLIFPLFSYHHLFFSFSSGPVLLLLLLPLSYFIAFLCCFYTSLLLLHCIYLFMWDCLVWLYITWLSYTLIHDDKNTHQWKIIGCLAFRKVQS